MALFNTIQDDFVFLNFYLLQLTNIMYLLAVLLCIMLQWFLRYNKIQK